MDFINKLLDENYDWGDKRIDEDVYDELSAELIIDYLKKHDSEIRQMLALSWNFDNPKKVIQWIVEQPDTDKRNMPATLLADGSRFQQTVCKP